MPEYVVRPLDRESWDAYAALVERHNGVWGGCWCMAFHPEGIGKHKAPGQNRSEKECRVREGRSHAALVFDGDLCVGWCQYGPTSDLPRIKHRKAYEAGLGDLPDWRITCFFVDKAYRGTGVARSALEGAVALIREAGGGVVESYPEDVTGRKISSSFLHNATVGLFERVGFVRVRPLNSHHWVVRLTVEP